MKKKNLLIGILTFGLIVFSCEKDPASTSGTGVDVKHNGAFIINEGGFESNNGSVSFYSPDDQQVQNNIFQKVNDLEELGDVVQSMAVIDGLGFVVINNSNKIEVIDMETWQRVKTINMPDGSSPKYLADGGNGKAYVTNLYGNSVSVIDLSAIEIQSSIPVGANPEEITVAGSKTYVANSGGGDGNTVSVIDLQTDRVVSTITVGDNPVFIKKHVNGMLHVLCWGSWNKGTDGGIYAIDPGTDTVTDSLIMPGYSSNICLGLNNTGYLINDGNILSFNTDKYTIINDSLITGSFYGIAFDPVSGHIFALDAKDFVQKGSLTIYEPDGSPVSSFEVGVVPSQITFIYE